VTPTNKLSSFLLIFELFSLIFYWKYSIFLHETPHTWNMISEKSSNISRKLLSLLVGVTKVNIMWCVFHNAQWYWSDNLCKLVTDQWRGSLGVRVVFPNKVCNNLLHFSTTTTIFSFVRHEYEKMKIKDTNIFNTVGVCLKKTKQWLNP
jgi:hypothetical protein